MQILFGPGNWGSREELQMSRNTKTILGISGGTLLLCMGLVVAFFVFAEWQNRRMLANMHITDPAIIAQVANGMGNYDLPPNYNERFVSKLRTTNALYLIVDEDTPDSRSHPIITLIHFPPERYLSARAARENLRHAGPEIETEWGRATLEVTDEVTTIVRGQEVGLTYYKWFGAEGNEYRAIISDIFTGKTGFLQLKIEGPARGWNEEMIDSFIQSIR